MDSALMIFTGWSTAIFAVIEAIQRMPGVREHPGWARALPMMPLLLGGISGPAVLPLLAPHLPWLTQVGPPEAVMMGIGAGAVAASGHSARKQTLGGRDPRISGGR
ncbi:hypothetical protein DL240_09130 [Lujinxingia litoralis]|uniref:Uncharacterized protein n=1 Tax=Lujinxingia litoralis TaxID=2211119 RepID=A0A328C876_9DELT|nr:hypothetical protein [Lujinxingia litoralis]RAL23038.1 hypothetical protein DL240_09130 [Lujinxingia litoralis]